LGPDYQELRLSCGCLRYESVSALIVGGSGDNTGTSAIVRGTRLRSRMAPI